MILIPKEQQPSHGHYPNAVGATVLIFASALFVFYFNTPFRIPTLQISTTVDTVDDDQSGCRVQPRFLAPEEVDADSAQGEVPQHVAEFDEKGYKLPKYPSSELFLVSVTSNASYGRRIAQENTIGRIFDIEYVKPSDFPVCVLCEQADQNDTCHCPSFRTPCNQHIFFDKSNGWWCATRRELFALKVGLDRRKDEELPKWVHVMEDQTFVNPIGEMLMLNELDPDVPYWIGDDWGAFSGGGCGKLASRGLLKLLLGPPVDPIVKHRWPNGTRVIAPETQIDSCYERYQGGDWCYYHGDWAATACVNEVGVNLTDLGLKQHLGFFSQLMQHPLNSSTLQWFGIDDLGLAKTLHRTHAIALHVSIEDMYDMFYRFIVPYYQRLRQFS